MKRKICETHEWGPEETLFTENFHVGHGAKKTCKNCPVTAFSDYCEGRVGGPWRNFIKKGKKWVEIDS